MKRDKQEGPRYRGAFLLASVLHFYSGQPLQNLTGVDSDPLSLAGPGPFLSSSTVIPTLLRQVHRTKNNEEAQSGSQKVEQS
jgi:hypothetical protein